MSKKTIYKFFPTKEMLIEKIIGFATNQIDNKYKSIVALDEHPLTKFWKMIYIIYSHHHFKPEKVLLLKSKYPNTWKNVEKFRLNNLKYYQSVFEDAQKLGFVDKDRDIKIASILFMNIVNSTFQPEFFHQYKLQPKEIILMFAEIYSRGLFGDITMEYKHKVFPIKSDR